MRSLLRFVLVALFFFPGVFALGQAYTSIVVIGDSLSDTGNDTYVSGHTVTAGVPVPSPVTGYTNGSFTNGTDTSPAAHNYFGVWVQQLAAKLAANPPVVNSIAGGNNYAYGFATTGTGTSAFNYGPNNVLTFPVNNMGLQLSTYLGTNPTITNKTLFVVWGGANDLINATSLTDIQNAAQREAGIVQALINAGATDFIVPNLPPLGAVPRFNTMPAVSAQDTAAAAGFNQYLAAYLAGIPPANPGKTLHLYPLDVFTLFNTILAAPANYGFANVTAMSQGNTAINPDTYLFWDSLHPTTYGHSLIASAALTLLGTPIVTTTTLASSNLSANLNASVTLTATVTGTTGTPVGNVTFLDGTTVLGQSVVTGTNTSGKATVTTSTLAAGTHNITATFVGVNGYASSSTTASIAQIVTAPALTTTLASGTLVISPGASGSVVLSVNPVGGYSGTVSFACGTLPAHFTCSFAPTSLSLPGTNAQVSTTITIGTSAAASLQRPVMPGMSHGGEIVLAFTLFPGFGLLSVAAIRRRKGLRGTVFSAVLALAAGAFALGLTGCGGNGNNAARGVYNVPYTVTANGTTTTNVVNVLVQ